MIGKYLNDYTNNPPIPPGWSEWHAAAPNDQDVYNYTLNENGTLVHYGQRSGRLQAGRADREGGRLRRPPGAEADSRSSSGSPTRRPTSAARTRTRTRPSTAAGRREAGAAPRPRLRLRAAAEAPELQRGGRLRQAGRDPEPPALERGSDRRHPAQVPLRARVAAVGGRGGQEGRRRAEGEAASSTTRCSSTRPTTATSTASTGSRKASCTSTRSRSGCRSRCAGRASRRG